MYDETSPNHIDTKKTKLSANALKGLGACAKRKRLVFYVGCSRI